MIALLLLAATVGRGAAPDTIPGITLSEALAAGVAVTPAYVTSVGALENAEWGRRAARLTFLLPTITTSASYQELSTSQFNIGIGSAASAFGVAAIDARYDLFTGVDNLAFEALAVGAVGWVAGLVTAFPRETVAIYQLMKQGRQAEALAIYRWFRPLLDLDVSTYLVQNIKLAEVLEIGTNDRVRMPRMPLSGDRRTQAEAVVRAAIASRPALPAF